MATRRTVIPRSPAVLPRSPQCGLPIPLPLRSASPVLRSVPPVVQRTRNHLVPVLPRQRGRSLIEDFVALLGISSVRQIAPSKLIFFDPQFGAFPIQIGRASCRERV